MKREILYGADARKKIQDGVNKVANAVCVTLGPKGKNVVISKAIPSPDGMKYYQPVVTKDGVSVVRHIILDDYLENVGCLMIREASEKTMLLVGDATTTTCLLTQEILNGGMTYLDAGSNPQELKRGIESAVDEVVEKLKSMSIPVGDDAEKIRQIATVSANNDPEIGGLIAEAFSKIGKDGIISLEESKNAKTEIKVVGGIKINRGWLSHQFINNHAKQSVDLEYPYILLYDKKLYQLEALQPILVQAINSGRPLLIIADDADGEALGAVLHNVVRGGKQICIIKAPGFSETRSKEMEDLALLTGGYYVSEEKGVSLKNISLSHLGQAERVIVEKEKTTIVGGLGDTIKSEKLIQDLKELIVDSSEEEKTDIENRISTLSGNAASLYVGAATETEMKEKKDRCDDAIRAVRAAIQEGIVPGGGTAFVRCIPSKALEGASDYHKGRFLISVVMAGPITKICDNAGVSSKEVVAKVMNGDFGYNAKTGVYEDLVLAGIIDPTKALRCSLQHAASTAAMILNSEALICDVM